MNVVRVILFPFAILYGAITGIRNLLFDLGILPSRSFDHPLIGIGNLSTGGTGKTPHIEYLIKLLKPNYKVATLSRGYKRKTKGFVLAQKNSTIDEIGDEPLQMLTNHPDISVAVCENRVMGIKTLLSTKPENQVILLDDVFQHRYVKPGLNILLTDYHNLFTDNYLVPTGDLRESRRNASRADILIITKSPQIFSPLDKRLILEKVGKYNIRQIFFSYIKYGDWKPFNEKGTKFNYQKAKTIFLLTGIANPIPLAEHLKRYCSELKTLRFSDHHQFSEKELGAVADLYHSTFGSSKAIVTSQKDSMRLRNPLLQKILSDVPVYYIPIEVAFQPCDKQIFDSLIESYMQNFASKKRE